MKVLAITNLFPNNMQPERGVFNKQQFTRLAKQCELRVIAPVPWVPWIRGLSVGTQRSVFVNVSKREEVSGIHVYHPRYFIIPKIGRCFYGLFLFLGIIRTVREIYKEFKFDAILATWAYPDAFAAALVACVFKKPLVIKVHGTDINVGTKFLLRRKMIQFALGQANQIISVTRALKNKIVQLGIPEGKVTIIPNGVDPEIFKALDKKECRHTLGLSHDKKHVVFIGNLTPIKGIKYLIEAISFLPEDIVLTIVGAGELQKSLDKEVEELNLSSRITFVGKRSHEEIPVWMNAADVFCLPSLNEGCPNVILESLACGTPVVASHVGGIPEIINSEDFGVLVEPKQSKDLAEAIQKALSREWDEAKMLQYVSMFDWEKGVQKIKEILNGSLNGKQS